MKKCPYCGAQVDFVILTATSPVLKIAAIVLSPLVILIVSVEKI